MVMLKDENGNDYSIAPIYNGGDCFLGIGKNSLQVGNPSLDANTIVKLIRELKRVLEEMTE